MDAALFDDHWTNLLFVGRMIPSKRVEDVIRWFEAYKRLFNRQSRLLLVGSHSGFERYVATLHQFAREIGASDFHFLGHVSNEELAACYDVADVFVCASEHEGFCVPLIEAFYMGVPVIAYAAAAVPDTMDGGGILVHDKDPAAVATLIDQVTDNPAFQDRVLCAQDQALARLQACDFGRTLLRFVDDVQRQPRRPHPAVASDFWDGVKDAQKLARIRRYRPSAFQALPRAADME